jgi:flagellar hook protein FlgE
MSLYGVLRSGVSGMNAQSNKLGTVAENIQELEHERVQASFDGVLIPYSSLKRRQL